MVFGQESVWKSFDIQFQYGLSLPVGSFSRTDYPSIFEERTGSTGKFYEGIQKAQNGYAKPGTQLSLGLGFQTKTPLKFSVFYQKSQNAVAFDQLETTIREGLPQPVPRRQNLVHPDYQLQSFLSEVAYVWKKDKLKADIGLLTGLGRLEYPDYAYFYEPFNLAHDGPKEPIDALMMGISSSLTYAILPWINIGGKISYQRGDFNYRYVLRSIPGGSNYTYFNDEVNHRTLNAGIQIQITW